MRTNLVTNGRFLASALLMGAALICFTTNAEIAKKTTATKSAATTTKATTKATTTAKKATTTTTKTTTAATKAATTATATAATATATAPATTMAAAATTTVTDPKIEAQAKALTDKMKESLSLTDEQYLLVYEANLKYLKKNTAATSKSESSLAKIKAVQTAAQTKETEMKAILTEEQFQKYQGVKDKVKATAVEKLKKLKF